LEKADSQSEEELSRESESSLNQILPFRKDVFESTLHSLKEEKVSSIIRECQGSQAANALGNFLSEISDSNERTLELLLTVIERGIQ
jgi:small-conductance mechanosensitive channel